jgi:crotonobetaine/carnitine-CoA ligase
VSGRSSVPPLPLDVPPEDDDAGVLALDPGWVLPVRVAGWARDAPNRPFLAEVTGRTATYAQAWKGVSDWAAWLQQQGVRRGDRVVSMLPASIDAVLLWLAAGCLGAVEVPVNPDLRGVFLEHALADSDPALCVVRPESETVVREGGAARLAVQVVERGWRPPRSDEQIRCLPGPEDPACVIYTSGTTGLPKGVLLSWAQFTATIGRIPRSWLSDADAVYCCHPMFHVTGRTPLLSMADVGGRVVLRERFSAGDFLDDVRAYACTSTTAYVALLLATPERDDDADNPLRIVFGSHSAALDEQFAARFDVRVLEAYGSTEAGFPIVMRTPPPDTSHRWCGRVRRGYTLRIVDAEGRDVPDGTPGELWVRPPARPLVLLEYVNAPEATASALVDGWYRTGDAVLRHSDGNVEFVDRLRDTIRRHGENISSSAVEGIVAAEPDVLECAVIGVPDPVSGQEVLLAVVPAAGVLLEPADLWARLQGQLPRYMLPSYVIVCAELPHTPTSKVRKAGLLSELDLNRAWRPTTRRGRPPACS